MADKPSKLRRLANDWRAWGAVLAVVLGVYQTAPAIGLELPRWTWWGEFQDFKLKVNSKFADVATAQIKSERELLRTRRDVLRGQLWQVEREIRERLRANQPVPESLYRERARLRDAIEGVRSKLVPRAGP